jgi:hypothetical protein
MCFVTCADHFEPLPYKGCRTESTAGRVRLNNNFLPPVTPTKYFTSPCKGELKLLSEGECYVLWDGCR